MIDETAIPASALIARDEHCGREGHGATDTVKTSVDVTRVPVGVTQDVLAVRCECGLQFWPEQIQDVGEVG